MPTKTLSSQTGNKGIQVANKFGGGANTVIAIDDGTSDYGYIIDGGGGDDLITGSDYVFDGVADTGTILDPRTENGDLLIGGDGSDVIIGGLGDDWIFGGAEDGTDGGKGKDPVVKNDLYGDFDNLAVGANQSVTGFADHIFGGNGVDNSMYGDNFGTLSLGTNALFTGGNDEITGGDGPNGEFVNNLLIGDTQNVLGSSNNSFTGGHDTLTGGSGVNVNNIMIGDANSLSDVATITGGDDILISGTQADDSMTGDWGGNPAGDVTGGADTFVFGIDNGDDLITDLRAGDGDMIDLIAFGFAGRDFGGASAYATLDDLMADLITGGGTAVIDFGADDDGLAGAGTITVSGWTEEALEAAINTVFDFV
jgi:hypothetical protein